MAESVPIVDNGDAGRVAGDDRRQALAGLAAGPDIDPVREQRSGGVKFGPGDPRPIAVAADGGRFLARAERIIAFLDLDPHIDAVVSTLP